MDSTVADPGPPHPDVGFPAPQARVGRPRQPRAQFGYRFRRALPWLVFGLGFLITTGIGASIIGLSNGERWGLNPLRSEELGLDTKTLNDRIYGSPIYWALLFLCTLVPIAGAMLAWLTHASPKAWTASRGVDLGLLRIARFIYFTGIAWLLLRVAVLVPEPLQTIQGAWTGTIETHYQVRYLVMSLLTRPEFGLAYTGLLTLLAIPLYHALIVFKTKRAWFEVMVWYAAYWVLAVALIQKLLISYSLLMFGLAILSSGAVGKYWKRLMLVGALFLVLIHTVMSSLVETWSWTSTIDHILGRSADSYPYAIDAGQQHAFSPGQYLVGSILGGPAFLGQPVNPNTDLYYTMYPDSDGAVTLAAPVWSYYDVGLSGALLTLGLVCGFCGLATWSARFAHPSAAGWSIYLLMLVQSYHLTQIPILGILFWSYGIFYGLGAVALAWVAANFSRRQRSR